jgi:hypothetical protein
VAATEVDFNASEAIDKMTVATVILPREVPGQLAQMNA